MPASMSHLRAIGFAIAGFALWVLSDSCMKLAGETALPPYEVLAFFGLSGALIMVLKARTGAKIKSLWPVHPRSQLGRCVLGIVGIGCNLIALKHLPLTLFYVTVFTAPLMISLLAHFFLRERLNVPRFVAIVVGFVGVVIATNPLGATKGGDWIGYTAATVSAISFAANVTWLRVMSQRETPDSMAFFCALITGLVGLSLMLVLQAAPVSLYLFLILCAMGTLSVVGNLFNFTALKRIPAAMVSQFHYTQLITGALVGFLVWHEIPTLHLLAGAVLIAGSGIYIAAKARKAEMLAVVVSH